MRLDRLDLTRYGRFTDRSIAFALPATGAPDLHIVYGPNEAGKSTLFSAWLDLLFGVPMRTRYDFLHPGPTIQIGARLSHDGTALDLKRLKRNSGSLLDRHDAPLPEVTLQGALGGMSREGYSAMFSLDDETLEKGGESILANRGDLGEMLFSASAGLSSLAPQLEALRAGLDGFHRSGKRSGWLYDSKKQLADLEAQRKALEISASALQKLTREAAACEDDWRAARSREDATQAGLDRLQELAGTLPLLAQLGTLEARLAPLWDLPDATAETAERFDAIESERHDLVRRIAERALRVQNLHEQLAALPSDPAVLAQTAAIETAETLRPAHETALADLPRRREALDVAMAAIGALLAKLGQEAAAPAELCLAAPQIVAMRALLAERSGLRNAATSTAAETRKAADLLMRERERLGDPGLAEEETVLAALLSRLRAQDPAEALARARRDRDLARSRLDGSLSALAPWQGDSEILAEMLVPTGWQINSWEVALNTAHQQHQDAHREAAALRDEMARLQAEAGAKAAAQTASGITLADAAKARSQREAQWAAHMADLSAESARRFEQALREDDRISSLLAEAISAAKREALDQTAIATLSARIGAAETRIEAALTTKRETHAAVEAASRTLGLTGGQLADLTLWLDRRITALADRAELRDAETTVLRCSEARDAACRALATALGRDEVVPAEAFETLLANAVARLEASERRREARRRIQTLSADLREREQAEVDARAALQSWQKSWYDAARGSLLETWSDDDPSLGGLLDLLDRLGAEHQGVLALQDRIAKMEANRQIFVAAQSDILRALALDATTRWSDLQSRLRRAQDAARDREMLTRQLESERLYDSEDSRRRAARDADAAEIGVTLGWSEASGDLADHVARCREAASLRQSIAALKNQLRERPSPAADENTDSIRDSITQLKAEVQLQRAETEKLLSALLEAKRRIDAVGGDDALARIAAARENLLLEIRDRAEAHLAERFGLIAFETGLRRYRDQHRSAMLARASAAFSTLSRGAYTGLAAQPDGPHEVLVALSEGGGAKLAVDLSKGTRFQLYLALRIAGYHELAKTRPTVPFIADDIMETFDDNRSAATFSLLAEMSRVGQVIYLTHHRHLCDIAQSICPDTNVIDLQSL